MVPNEIFESELCGESGVRRSWVWHWKVERAVKDLGTVGLHFLLSVDSCTLERVACVQLADAKLTLISFFQSKSALKSAMFGLSGA